MPALTEKQIQYGPFYSHADDPPLKSLAEVSHYRGEPALTIICTQLGGDLDPQYRDPKEKKRVLREWCDFLVANPLAFKELSFPTRMPQELFDAVCAQKQLKRLSIKWGAYSDLSRLASLQHLEYLYFGSGAGVLSLEPIASLSSLTALCLENFQKISDYRPLAKLRKLEALYLEGNAFHPQFIRVDSLDFLKDMPQLRFFRFLTARLTDKDMTPVLSLLNVEHLTLEASRETRALYDRIRALPKLKYGFVAENPDIYRRESKAGQRL